METARHKRRSMNIDERIENTWQKLEKARG